MSLFDNDTAKKSSVFSHHRVCPLTALPVQILQHISQIQKEKINPTSKMEMHTYI